MIDAQKCSICNGPLYHPDLQWICGNNAEPINDGRCCDNCNWITVLPARLREAQSSNRARAERCDPHDIE